MTGIDETLIYIAFKMVLQLLAFLISLILSPIYVLLSPFIPDTTDIINAIDSVFLFLNNAISFVIGWIHLPPIAINLIYGYLAFILIWYPTQLFYTIAIRMYKAFKG